MNALKPKNGFGKVLAVALAITLVFVAGVITGRYVVTSPGLVKSERISKVGGIEGASYIIFKEGSTYYAKNGKTGAIDYSGTNASLIIQNAIDSMSTYGGTISFRRADYNFTSYGVALNGASWYGIELKFEAGTRLLYYGTGTLVHINGTSRNKITGFPSVVLHGAGSKTAIWIQGHAASASHSNIVEINAITTGNDSQVNTGYTGILVTGVAHYNDVEVRAFGGMDTCVNVTNIANANNFKLTVGGYANIALYVDSADNYFHIQLSSGQTINGTQFTSNGDANHGYLYYESSGYAVIWESGASGNVIELNQLAGTALDDQSGITSNRIRVTNSWLQNYNFQTSLRTHPDTDSWGNDQKGQLWFCTTHGNMEYWDGTNVIYWNATGTGVEP